MAKVLVVGVAHSPNDPVYHEGHAYVPQQIGEKRFIPTLVAFAQQRGDYVKKVKKIIYCETKPEIGQWLNARLI